ncbi:hypothetical protein AFLA_010305 [Aspergillus flavus NRRL3357]|nr:hypothetical protein AFLA_010305 [Aspergillus flavus NRRL3357]
MRIAVPLVEFLSQIPVHINNAHIKLAERILIGITKPFFSILACRSTLISTHIPCVIVSDKSLTIIS